MKCDCTPFPRLKHRVTIIRPDPNAVKDDGGQIDLSDDANWIKVGERKAQIITRGGTERMRFGQIAAEVNRIFVLRSDKLTRSIQPTWRIKHLQDGTFKVTDISAAFDVDADRRSVEVHGTEIVD